MEMQNAEKDQIGEVLAGNDTRTDLQESDAPALNVTESPATEQAGRRIV